MSKYVNSVGAGVKAYVVVPVEMKSAKKLEEFYVSLEPLEPAKVLEYWGHIVNGQTAPFFIDESYSNLCSKVLNLHHFIFVNTPAKALPEEFWRSFNFCLNFASIFSLDIESIFDKVDALLKASTVSPFAISDIPTFIDKGVQNV